MQGAGDSEPNQMKILPYLRILGGFKPVNRQLQCNVGSVLRITTRLKQKTGGLQIWTGELEKSFQPLSSGIYGENKRVTSNQPGEVGGPERVLQAHEMASGKVWRSQQAGAVWEH